MAVASAIPLGAGRRVEGVELHSLTHSLPRVRSTTGVVCLVFRCIRVVYVPVLVGAGLECDRNPSGARTLGYVISQNLGG